MSLKMAPLKSMHEKKLNSWVSPLPCNRDSVAFFLPSPTKQCLHKWKSWTWDTAGLKTEECAENLKFFHGPRLSGVIMAQRSQTIVWIVILSGIRAKEEAVRGESWRRNSRLSIDYTEICQVWGQTMSPLYKGATFPPWQAAGESHEGNPQKFPFTKIPWHICYIEIGKLRSIL